MTVFHQIGEGRTLLILGEPGSGKTITLLKLAQNLIARTEEDVSQLIPAPFNLSSWARKRQPIATWLVQELYEKYQISTAFAKELIEREQLILAKRMHQSAQTIFLIEDLQPNWLTYRHSVLAHRVVCGVVTICLGWLAIVVYGLFGGLFLGISLGADSEGFLWFSLQNGYEILAGIKFEIIMLLMLSALVAGIGPAEIKTVETLKWHWQALKKQFIPKVLIGLIAGWLFGKAWFELGWIGLIGGLIFVIVFCGLEPSEFQGKDQPNQGIRKSYTNILVLGLLTGLTTMLPGMLATQLAGLSLESSLLWPYIELTVGATTGFLFGGGKACLQHFALRLMLYRMQDIPWNYARFLDYAASRLFLQKVGGGYIFVHRMLLEHFAQMRL